MWLFYCTLYIKSSVMPNPIKHLLVIIAVVFSSFAFYPALASHLSGADITYKFVGIVGGQYQYQVSVTIYEDCLNGDPAAIAQDNPAYVVVFDGAGSLIRFDSLFASAILIPSIYDSACSSHWTPMCLQKRMFVTTYSLSPNSSGYVVAYQRCCMGTSIVDLVNPGSIGMTAFCTIPPPPKTNNSAVFTNYPPEILAINKPFAFDFSATDADGDSLSYAFCSPYTGGNDNNAKPVPLRHPMTR